MAMPLGFVAKKDDEEEVALDRNKLILEQARDAGLLGAAKDFKVSGRVSTVLIEAAKARAHINSVSDLLELALSRLALEDDFGRKFLRRKGTVPKDVDLEF